MARTVYKNAGNLDLLAELMPCGCVLDVGCGAGDNARLINQKYPDCEIFGITHSSAESDLARLWMNQCWCVDLEDVEALNSYINGRVFDAILCSHVLEHLRDPAGLLARLECHLAPGGQVLIAVPNVLNYRTRWQFLTGRFEYEKAGILDETHLRFFTYFTADRFLLSRTTELKLEKKSATGSMPLWIFRRYLLPRRWSSIFDQLATRFWPNLFGGQVIISAIKSATSVMHTNLSSVRH